MKIGSLKARRLAAAALVLPALCAAAACGPTWPASAARVSRAPVLSLDYAGTVIPPNIAPLNFRVSEPGSLFMARLTGEKGGLLEVSSRDGRIAWPSRAWKPLIAQNRGGTVTLTIAVQDGAGAWRTFDPVRMDVAQEPLDRYLVYRLIPPVDRFYREMGIYERDLEGFSERPVIENQNFSVANDGCINCHSFGRNRPRRMSLQIRSATVGKLMIITKDGVAQKVDTSASGFSTSPAAYQEWHPDGRHIGFSVNKPRPLEHSIGEHRDVWDDDSDLAVYDTETNGVTTTADISDPARRETWPAWSADGRTLYFSSAPQMPLSQLKDVKYDLVRIAYDPAAETWGRKETILSAADSGLSALQPKESPDGRWLLFVLADYGSFPVYQPTGALHVIDLKTGERRPLATVNAGWNSWHSWSSNGRWIAFSSKRVGSVLSRIYFTYFDRDGQAHKPFVLPQEDPSFYESCTLTYNVPELIIEPVPVSASELGRAIAEKAKLPAPSLVRQ